MKFILALLMSQAVIASPCPHPARHDAPKIAFAHLHACPSTGLHIPHCPGYVIDHRHALCQCGPDSASNMAWMTVAKAKEKDRWECKPGWEAKLKACDVSGNCFASKP